MSTTTVNKTIKDTNSLAILRPDLALQWNTDKNTHIQLSNATIGSSKKVWWTCEKGHEWECVIHKRTKRGQGCPYCSNQRVSPDNCLNAVDPFLSKEWDMQKNAPLTPFDVTSGSSKKVWWLCSTCSYNWQTAVCHRKKGTGCPTCQKKKQKKTFLKNKIAKQGSLHDINPSLSEEWHPVKNGTLTAKDLTIGSSKKVWWTCKKGHEWEAVVFSRNSGCGCPYCTNQKVNDENSLLTSEHTCINEWHYAKNFPLTPNDVIKGSIQKVWWLCPKGHEWEATISSRTSTSNHNCPYCAGKRVCEDNSLATHYPDLAKEWDYEKNKNHTPHTVTPKSDKYAWWSCKIGHSWKTQIKNRARGNGCPKCYSKTSYPEQYLLYFLSKVFESDNRKKIGRFEADIFLPQLPLAIEYDGVYWHKGKEDKDLRKNKGFYDKNVQLIRIREDDLTPLNEFNTTNLHISCNPSDNELEIVVRELFTYIAENFELTEDTLHKILNLNFNIPKNNILEEFTFLTLEKSLVSVFPHLKEEWNYEKNGKLLPEHFTPFSGKKVWWKCQKGHEWVSVICNRGKNGCPYCAHQLASKEYNLAIFHPRLVSEWNHKRNDKKPYEYTPSSGQKVWWKCIHNHEWLATIDSRSTGSNCPYCSGRRVTKETSIANLFPRLLDEWDYEKNESFNPSKLGKGSHKKVSWKCKNEHSWDAYIYSRTSGAGCPTCYVNKRKNA